MARPQGFERKTLLLVQILRAVAALMVVGYHITVLLAEQLHITKFVFINGNAGVDIFFVISGLVMVISSRPLVEHANPGREFFVRRVERIVPLYWLAITLKLVIVGLVPAAAAERPDSLWHVVSSYFFLPTLRYAYPVLVVGWTLNYEMFFYLFFAIALSTRLGVLRVLAPALGLIALRSFFMPPVLWAGQDRLLLEFLSGIILGYAWLAGWLPGRTWSTALLVAGFAALLTLHPGPGMTRAIVWGLPALAIVTGAVGLESALHEKAPASLVAIGEASYAIYLFHVFILPPIGMLLVFVSFNRAFASISAIIFGMLGSILIGVVIHRTLEKPLVRFLRQRRQIAAPAKEPTPVL